MSLLSRLFNFCSNPNETRDIDTSPIDPRTPTFFHKKKTRHLSNIVNLPNSSLKASDLKKLLNSNTKENNESILNQSSLNDDFQEHNAVSMNSSDFMNPNKNISLNNEIHDETKNIKNEISNQHNESLVTDHQILEITQNLENKSTNQHTIQSQKKFKMNLQMHNIRIQIKVQSKIHILQAIIKKKKRLNQMIIKAKRKLQIFKLIILNNQIPKFKINLYHFKTIKSIFNPYL